MQSCQRSRVLLVDLSPFGLSSSSSPERAHFLALTLTCARGEYTPALLKACSISSTFHSNSKASSGVHPGVQWGAGKWSFFLVPLDLAMLRSSITIRERGEEILDTVSDLHHNTLAD